MAKEFPMSPADVQTLHEALDRVSEGLGRCLVRSAAMADFPEAVPGLLAAPPGRRLPPPPLRRGALPPTDED
jgi:hypothetical protein